MEELNVASVLQYAFVAFCYIAALLIARKTYKDWKKTKNKE